MTGFVKLLTFKAVVKEAGKLFNCKFSLQTLSGKKIIVAPLIFFFKNVELDTERPTLTKGNVV